MRRIVSELLDVNPAVDVLLTPKELEEFLAVVKSLGLNKAAKGKKAVDFLLSLASTAKAGTMLPGALEDLAVANQEIKRLKALGDEYYRRWEVVCGVVDEKTEQIETLRASRPVQRPHKTPRRVPAASPQIDTSLPTWML